MIHNRMPLNIFSDIEKFPEEVREYYMIHFRTGGTMDFASFNRCKEIEKKYPEYFPWETLYASIPAEVHDAYREEANRKFTGMFTSNDNPDGFIGIIPSIMKGPQVVNYESGKSLFELIGNLIEAKDKRILNEAKRREENKAIWDKHYVKYKLEYRDGY